jgi:hypothetical protein
LDIAGDARRGDIAAAAWSPRKSSLDDPYSLDVGCRKEDGGGECQFLTEMEVHEKRPYKLKKQTEIIYIIEIL